ncbi:MAG: arginase family protein [Fibrobacter sp.]|uniref:arginase family protein n=1 Tax=Fibrobacter sp. TaxID=35828 RepID=UPI001B0A02A5|nr:arginase family protein [Fibrobacter sp.]MBO7061493.1 arginase family protein [Fibrobacter sp.]
MQITIHDFSGVYSEQQFMQSLRESSEALWLDGSGIAGTDCYCDDEAVAAIRGQIADAGITDARAIHFIDGGNYHYMSKIWTDMVQEPFTLVVFDHHPDMQAPRFGGILSCGSWVLEVLNTNKFVEKVILVGVADHLVDEIRQEIASDASNDAPSILDKVTFIKESELGKEIPGQAGEDKSRLSSKLYLSIDKDALAPAFAATNWDQGSLSTESLKSIIAGLAANHKIIGVDICGERARDIEDSRADALNSGLNRELAEFLLEIL